MATAVRFLNLERSDVLEGVVRDTFENMLGGRSSRLRADDPRMEVCVRVDSLSPLPASRIFHCELIFSSSRFPKIFVRRSGENFYKAVAAAAASLHKLLERTARRALRPAEAKAQTLKRETVDTFYFLEAQKKGRRPKAPAPRFRESIRAQLH